MVTFISFGQNNFHTVKKFHFGTVVVEVELPGIFYPENPNSYQDSAAVVEA